MPIDKVYYHETGVPVKDGTQPDPIATKSNHEDISQGNKPRKSTYLLLTNGLKFARL